MISSYRGRNRCRNLKLWEHQTFDAIAETLGVSLNTAASRYRYGLDKLRQRLRPLYDEII